MEVIEGWGDSKTALYNKNKGTANDAILIFFDEE